MKNILLIALFISTFSWAQTPIYKFQFNNSVSDATNSSVNFVSNGANSDSILDELMIINKALSQTEILALSFMDANALSGSNCPSGDVTITSQAEADALANCTHITGYLEINMNYEILDFTPLQNITTIDGSLYITELGNTGVLNILPNLTTIGGAIAMYGNSLITSVEGFSSITSLDGLVVSGSFNLTTFNAFQNLQSVNYITVNSCQNLTTIEPFSQLAAFNNLRIEYTALTNLNFLSNVSTVLNNPFYNSIILKNNNNLSDISALNGLTASNFTEFDEIVIQNNPLLSACAVDLVCSYLASPETNKTIANNATGCESVAVVDAACEALSINEFNVTNVKIFPVPFIDSLNIVLNDTYQGQVKIIDLTGKILYQNSFNGFEININNLGHLSKGVYVLQIENNYGQSINHKIIK